MVVVLALEPGEVVLSLCYGVGVALAPIVLALALPAEAGDDLGHLPQAYSLLFCISWCKSVVYKFAPRDHQRDGGV